MDGSTRALRKYLPPKNVTWDINEIKPAIFAEREWPIGSPI